MLPAIEGVMERRLLVNFRVDPARVEPLLPPGLRPQTVGGQAIVGICLIRLGQLRPVGLPGWLGLNSENAAHRFAVAWDVGDETRTGVYIPRRDTDSALNVRLGGRLFPGMHHAARFTSKESSDRIAVRMRSDDGAVAVRVEGSASRTLPGTSVFRSVEQASQFFAKDSQGLSPRADGSLECLELQAFNWSVTPVHVTTVTSTFMRSNFGDAAEFDNALLMRDIHHRWHERRAWAAAA